jgi:NPCBM-associated, NEW3 domain of alpha-galactosidase
MTPVLSELRVEQKITPNGPLYMVAPKLKISFTLRQPSDVTVVVARHLAGYEQFKWPYLAEPFPVREFKLEKLEAGQHTVDWDGLDEKGQPVVEVQNVSPEELKALKLRTATPEQLTKTLPVNLLQVSVAAGKERLSANFDRAVETVQPDREIRPFRMAVLDRQGNYLVPDFEGACAWRYSPDWVPLGKWPKNTRGQGFDPDECEDVGVDSKGNIFAVNGSGVFRYGANDGGEATPWPVQSEYTKNKSFGHLLGKRTDDERFSGFAIDDQDNVYLGRRQPDPCVLVFDNDGRYLRSIPLPDGRVPRDIRWLGKGTLAVTAVGSNPEGVVLFVDAKSGSITKRLEAGGESLLRIWAAPDGSFIAGHGAGIVRRFTREGEPLPFDPAVLNVRDGNELRFAPHEFGLPKQAPGFPVHPNGYAIAPDGSFFVSEGIDTNSATLKSRLLSYAKGGAYQPTTLLASLGRHVPGNIFLDDAPAVFDLFVTNFSEHEQPFTVEWTLTDFEGKKASGTSKLTAAPMARQTLPFTVNAPEFGHYRLEAKVMQNGKLVEPMQAQMARIASRDTKEDRYSPFAMCLVGEFELMKLAGVKSHRGDSASWAKAVEPLEGVFYADQPQALQFARGGAESLRAYARREGFLLLNGLNYGENWLGGDWVGQPTHFVYSYDRYYDYCLRVLDRFSGKSEAFYQFWNEPDNFWRPKGPFGREHFAMVNKHVWSIVKARDKNALAVADGDAGKVEMMELFAEYGAADWNDTVQMHYPAAKVYAWDNMEFPDLPETKVPAIEKLVEIRDKSFPGKEVWNTEDTVPANPKTPEVAAANLPRMYIPQIAIGVDKIYMFPQTGISNTMHDVVSCLDEHGHPFPTFVSYATMSRMIDGAVYAGKADFDQGAYGYLFARGDGFVLAANSIAANKEVLLDVGVPRVKVVDLMGRSRELPADGGKLRLALSPQMQYVLLPRKSGAVKIAKAELKRQLDALNLQAAAAMPAEVTEAVKTKASDPRAAVKTLVSDPRGAARTAKAELKERLDVVNMQNAAAIPGQVAETVKTAASDPVAMNRLYYLIKAAKAAGAAGETPPVKIEGMAKAARQAVERREGADGYLRSARLALDWTERLAQEAGSDPSMGWALWLATQATQGLAAVENPVYPGVVVNAFVGEPGEIRKIRSIVPVANDPSTSIDDKFRFEIEREAGETFELELTVCNYYRHKIAGTMAPRLPEGWQATPAHVSYSLEPGKRQRFLFSVQIPQGAESQTYPLGGRTQYNGTEIQEIHASRVKL